MAQCLSMDGCLNNTLNKNTSRQQQPVDQPPHHLHPAVHDRRHQHSDQLTECVEVGPLSLHAWASESQRQVAAVQHARDMH